MVRIALLLLSGTLLGGCALGGGGSGKAGGPKPKESAVTGVVTLRYGTADPGTVQSVFFTELQRVSHGHLQMVPVAYDTLAPDGDQRVARDLLAGKLDIADIASRAWESLGVKAMRAYQSPFLFGSSGLLDRATADSRVAGPLLGSLRPLGVTGLAIQPAGIRYLFSRHAPLSSSEAFAGARVRVSSSALSTEIMRALGAQPTSKIANEMDTVAALERGRLDAVEANMHVAVDSGYASVAPYVSSPILAKVTTLVARTERLRTLGPQASAWVRTAAEKAAATVRDQDDRIEWNAACGGGLRVTPSTPAQLDQLQAKLVGVHATLEGDPATALAIDRIGLLAVRERAAEPWARCGKAAGSATRVLDGAYAFTITDADVARAGVGPGNDGRFRVEFGNGRYALFHRGAPDPRMPGWDFARDPVEVGSLVVDGDVATLRPETSLAVGSRPKTYRFALFRDRLSWRRVSGPPDLLMDARPWRKLEG